MVMDRSSDLISVVLLNVVSLTGLTVAWVWVSDQTTLAEQTSPLALGVAAVTLGAAGNALYLLAQRRRITTMLDKLLTPVRDDES